MSAAIVELITKATLIAGTALVSATATALGRRYALRRELLDLPGRRRSHTIATPRGGGVGPVLATFAGGVVLLWIYPGQMRVLSACLLGLAAVAAIGWLDDHRPLRAGFRLCVHVLAGLIAALALLGIPATSLQGLLLAVAVLWIVGLTNVWNFMDGIDGLATTQAILIVLCLLAGSRLHAWLDPAWSSFTLLFLGALLGFLPFNFPRAKIFLGDIGSGAFGFVIGCVLLRAVDSGGLPWPLVLLPVSAFMVDAGLTLAKRIAQRKHWWLAHREHLYQWLVRRGVSHLRVTLAYGYWTCATAVLALASANLSVRRSTWVALATLLLACMLWRWARMRLRSR